MVVELLGPVRALDRFQRGHAALAIPVAVLRNFSDQGASIAAALVSFSDQPSRCEHFCIFATF